MWKSIFTYRKTNYWIKILTRTIFIFFLSFSLFNPGYSQLRKMLKVEESKVPKTQGINRTWQFSGRIQTWNLRAFPGATVTQTRLSDGFVLGTNISVNAFTLVGYTTWYENYGFNGLPEGGTMMRTTPTHPYYTFVPAFQDGAIPTGWVVGEINFVASRFPTPALIQPVNNSVGIDTSGIDTLKWTRVTGATQYTLQIVQQDIQHHRCQAG
jgi:hypothetical protein